MLSDPESKLLARNVAAFRRFAPISTDQVVGNPVSTSLESGVGNCYPGLECDLRNLERRFIPFLEVDVVPTVAEIRLVEVDLNAVRAANRRDELTDAEAETYGELASELAGGSAVVVARLKGTFGPLGEREFDPRTLPNTSFGPDRLPPESWTAIRMIKEGTPLTVTFERPEGDPIELITTRSRYLDDNGALSSAFLPGELTQSLCSPWTHDFRDCGCHYWASNHPDIVQPVYPLGAPGEGVQKWTLEVPWQRSDRVIGTEPPIGAGLRRPADLAHYEINNRWEELHFVLNRREITSAFRAGEQPGTPLPDREALLAHLRYAAGVELAVAHEYLAAAYSLKTDDDAELGAVEGLRDSVRATRSEIMRIAIGEMRHTRAVNDVIRAVSPPGTFEPALRVADTLPKVGGSGHRLVLARVASRQAIIDFIEIEAPSAGVDGLYIDILATLKNPPPDIGEGIADEWAEAISSVIAEGEDHFQTFLDIQEWLDDFQEIQYLTDPNAVRPPADNPAHQALQAAYRNTLEGLHRGYVKGRLGGAADINAARGSMVGNGLDKLASEVAKGRFLVVFDKIDDPRFTPIPPPK